MVRSISVSVLGLLLCSAGFAQDETVKRYVAEKAAQTWLALVDNGGYLESWEQASSFFKSKITSADWEKAVQQVRAPFGAVHHRAPMGSVYQTDVPNAPRGEYVLIQYKTEFADGRKVIETITPMRDADGKWRVSGYFVKPAE